MLYDSSHHPREKYHSRVFDEQEGYRYTYVVRDGLFIETGAYLHWLNGKIVDVAFDLSCMSGCAYKCKFCSSSRYNNGVSPPMKSVEQVESTVLNLGYSQESFLSECGKFTFSFEGMGEPSIPDVSENIMKAIGAIRKRYSSESTKEIQFILSTIGAYPSVIRSWADEGLPLETLQLSLHAVSNLNRRRLVGATCQNVKEFLKRCRTSTRSAQEH